MTGVLSRASMKAWNSRAYKETVLDEPLRDAVEERDKLYVKTVQASTLISDTETRHPYDDDEEYDQRQTQPDFCEEPVGSPRW